MILSSGRRLHRSTVAGGTLAVLLAMARLALAQAPASPGAPPADAPSPIPLAEIAMRADDVTVFLAEVDETAASAAEIRAIESNLAEQAARLKASRADTLQRLGANPPLAVVERLAASWQATCATEVRAAADAVTGRAARLEQEVDRLGELREAWTRTRSDAVGAHAPAVVLGRIDEIRTAISSAKARLEARLAAILSQRRRCSSTSRSRSRCSWPPASSPGSGRSGDCRLWRDARWGRDAPWPPCSSSPSRRRSSQAPSGTRTSRG